MNHALMVLATKSCSLLFYLYPRIFVTQLLMVVATKSSSNPLLIRILMNQALMVVATKSCSNSFPNLLSMILFIIYTFFIYVSK